MNTIRTSLRKHPVASSAMTAFFLAAGMMALDRYDDQHRRPLALSDVPTTSWFAQNQNERERTVADCQARPEFYNRPVYETVCERANRAANVLAELK